MSDMGRNDDLRKALEKTIDAEHEALLASVPAEELEREPSPEFKNKMDELFAAEKKKRIPLFWGYAAAAAALIAAVIGLMALFGVFSKRPNESIDVYDNTPLPVSAAPVTVLPTGVLPSGTPYETAAPATGDPTPTQGATPVPYLTPMPTETLTDAPTDAPVTVLLPTEPPLPTDLPVTPGPTQTETPEPTVPMTDAPPPPITDAPTPPITDEPPIETEEPIATEEPQPTWEPPVTTEEPSYPTDEPTDEPLPIETEEPAETEAPTAPPYHVGDIITLGRYEQDNNIANGAEDIEWIVLSVQSSRMLVVSRYVLDAVPFDEASGSVWSSSSMRNGFLTGLYNTAFTSSERSLIRLTYNQNPANPVYGTPGGSDTSDRLFLLSFDDAYTRFGSNAARRCAPTAYAQARGVASVGGFCRWWLRTPGDVASSTCFIAYNGAIDIYGCESSSTDVGVRPAMWISFP